jgi:crotonobetainyl-CoA:carnitine CoA-transferase CaiB-like acyl-CoA transferase
VPHGEFACADEDGTRDRWVTIACWSDEQWARLASHMGVDDPSLATFEARRARVDEVEALVADWARGQRRTDVAEALQRDGIEAVPVYDFGDLHDDPQLASREHFVANTHPFMGDCLYERNGFRLEKYASGYDRSGPTLGQDNAWVLRDLLGLSDDEITTLEAAGAIE